MITTTPLTGTVPIATAPSRGTIRISPTDAQNLSGAAIARALVLAGVATQITASMFILHP